MVPNGPKEWTTEPVWRDTRSLVLSGVLGAGLFGVNLVVGSGLVYATGIPGLSAVVSGLFVPFVLALSLLITRRSGAAAMCWFVYSVLAVPTVLNGPPGFYKILIGVAAGAAFDLPVTLARGRRVSYFIGLILYTGVNLAAFVIAFNVLDLPGRAEFMSAVYVVAGIFLVEGFLGVYLAGLWYRRRLQGLAFVASFRQPEGE